MYPVFDDDARDLGHLFDLWADETQDLASRTSRFREFEARLEAAKAPFRAKESELLAMKKRKDKDAILTPEERDAIWRPFREIFRRIEREVYGFENFGGE